MSKSPAIASIMIFTLMSVAASCERAGELSAPAGGEAPLEERLEIEYDQDAGSPEAALLADTDVYPIFDAALLDLGYRIHAADAAAFRARDPLTGGEAFMTLIPCRRPADPSSIALLMYVRSADGGGWAVTAAEFREEDGYDTAHPIETSRLLAAGARCSPGAKERLMQMSESSSRYWKCVGKRVAAGCIGCATACALSGPGWGACTAACCAGVAIASLASCAFTVFLGW